MIVELETGHKLELPDGSSSAQIDEAVGHFMEANKAAQPRQGQQEQKANLNQDVSQKDEVGLGQTLLDQVLQGVSFGYGDELTDEVAARIVSTFSDYSYEDAHRAARDISQGRLDKEWEQHPITSLVANVAGGLVTGGIGAGTKAGAAIASSLRSGNAAARIAKGATTGAASGAVVGAGTAKDGERADGAIKGAAVGAVGGAAIPAIPAAARGLKSTALPKIDDAIAPLAQRARDFGIPLRLDQVSPTRVRKTIQKVSQEMPFSGVDDFEKKQLSGWMSAVAKTLGQDADDLSPNVIKAFRKENGKLFNDALKGEVISFSNNALKQIKGVAEEAKNTLNSDLAKVVKRNVDELLQDYRDGAITGEKLASYRTKLVKRATRAEGGVGKSLGEIVEVLDDLTMQNISPSKAEGLATARKQWRNYKTLQPLLEKSTDGTVNPTQLLNRVASNKYIDASKAAVGQDDLIDLARIGKEFMPKLGGSDTAQKIALVGGGGVMATALSNPLLALTVGGKALAGLGANRMLQKGNASQKLVDLAIKSSKEAKKEIPQIINPLQNLALQSQMSNLAVRR